MNNRLDLEAIAAHLRALPAFGGVHVSTGYSPDYWHEFGSTFPAVWVGAQRLTRRGDGVSANNYHQVMVAEVVFRLVAQRYAAGEVAPEGGLNSLHDKVVAAVANWSPPGAWGKSAFRFESTQDGDPSESVLTADLTFSVQVLYQGATP